MKIAILTEYYPDHTSPGSGVYVHTRASAYQAAGHEVRVYRPRRGAPPDSEYERIPIVSGSVETARGDCERFTADVVALHTPYPGSQHARLSERLRSPTMRASCGGCGGSWPGRRRSCTSPNGCGAPPNAACVLCTRARRR
jgi:hypothetical protein